MFFPLTGPPGRSLLCRPMPARAGRISPRGIRRPVPGPPGGAFGQYPAYRSDDLTQIPRQSGGGDFYAFILILRQAALTSIQILGDTQSTVKNPEASSKHVRAD
jgi:hypothetical protein